MRTQIGTLSYVVIPWNNRTKNLQNRFGKTDMFMIKRKIHSDIVDFYKSHNKALLLT